MTDLDQTDEHGKSPPAIASDGKLFARKGEASTLGFAVVMGPRISGAQPPRGDARSFGNGILLSVLVALVLSPVLVWGAFSVMDRLAEPPVVQVATPGTAEPTVADAPASAAIEPVMVTAATVLGPDVWVQLHAFDSREVASREAVRLGRNHADLLNGLRIHVAATRDPSGKPVFGLRAGAFADTAAARNLCNRAQKRQLSCIVLPPVVK